MNQLVSTVLAGCPIMDAAHYQWFLNQKQFDLCNPCERALPHLHLLLLHLLLSDRNYKVK